MGDRKGSLGVGAIQVLTVIVAFAASWFAVGLWAVGSEAYINEILLGTAPWVATWGILTRRYLIGAIFYTVAGIALLSGGWGLSQQRCH